MIYGVRHESCIGYYDISVFLISRGIVAYALTEVFKALSAAQLQAAW